ncbi:hypothetical protein NL676_020011 [Syzygium grande]|nr:hypothetical protein NL676_020011 [Syzygium grande]
MTKLEHPRVPIYGGSQVWEDSLRACVAPSTSAKGPKQLPLDWGQCKNRCFVDSGMPSLHNSHIGLEGGQASCFHFFVAFYCATMGLIHSKTAQRSPERQKK